MPTAQPTVSVITDDAECLKLLEDNLKDSIIETMRAYQMSDSVHGAFSIDDLEKQNPAAMGLGKVLFGVVYLGCKPVNEKSAGPADGGNGVQFTEFLFQVVIGGKVDTMCRQRMSHGRILTILRKEIIHSRVQYGRRPEMYRSWVFAQERPEIADSTEEMLYYSQSWSIRLPLVSK